MVVEEGAPAEVVFGVVPSGLASDDPSPAEDVPRAHEEHPNEPSFEPRRFWVTVLGWDLDQRRFTYCGIETPRRRVAAFEVWHRDGRWQLDFLFLREIIAWWRRRRAARRAGP